MNFDDFDKMIADLSAIDPTFSSAIDEIRKGAKADSTHLKYHNEEIDDSDDESEEDEEMVSKCDKMLVDLKNTEETENVAKTMEFMDRVKHLFNEDGTLTDKESFDKFMNDNLVKGELENFESDFNDLMKNAKKCEGPLIYKCESHKTDNLLDVFGKESSIQIDEIESNTTTDNILDGIEGNKGTSNDIKENKFITQTEFVFNEDGSQSIISTKN